MSILDKPLTPQPRRSRRGRMILLGAILLLLVVLFVFTDIRSDLLFIDHFLTPSKHFTYHSHTAYISAVAWSPDGKRITSASGDGTVQVWDAFTGGHVLTYRGHSGDVLTLVWSPDGRYIASGGLDRTVQVWNAATGAHRYTYQGHSDAVYDVAWSPNGTHIASASQDGTVQVWSAMAGALVFSYKSPFSMGSTDNTRAGRAPWYTVAWSPDSRQVAIGGNGDVEVWDIATGGKSIAYGHHGGIAHAIAWSPDGTYLAVGSSDSLVQLWDIGTGENSYNYSGHTADVLAVAWSPDGKRIASGSSDGTVQVWDALTGGHAYIYRGHADFYFGHFTSTAAVDALAWSPDGRDIASGGTDNTVQVWQVL